MAGCSEIERNVRLRTSGGGGRRVLVTDVWRCAHVCREAAGRGDAICSTVSAQKGRSLTACPDRLCPSGRQGTASAYVHTSPLLTIWRRGYRTNVVHNGAMRAEPKTVRQSVSLPSKTALQVRTMAKSKRVSAARMLRELIENGIEVEKRKQQEFFDLAERFRGEKNAEEAKRLGDQLGRMVFGG